MPSHLLVTGSIFSSLQKRQRRSSEEMMGSDSHGFLAAVLRLSTKCLGLCLVTKVFVNNQETMEKIRRREEAVFLNEGDKGLWEPTMTLLSPKDQRVQVCQSQIVK